MFRSILTVSMALMLISCGNRQNYSETAQAPTLDAEYRGAGTDESFSKTTEPSTSSQGDTQETVENPSAQSFLAYRYNYGFALPAKSVAHVAKSHAQLCLEAGTDTCQVLASNTSKHASDYVSATLQLRAEPQWLATFRADLETSVQDANGDMTYSGVSAEDLTRSILDTDARLNAQKTLRTRLENLLETRDAKLPDLLALERELARVQSDIESATTTLNVLKKRVSMSIVDINYQSQQVAVSRSAFSPISRAFKRFFGNIAEGTANVIEFFSLILPWLIFVILPGVWLVRWLWRRRRARPSEHA